MLDELVNSIGEKKIVFDPLKKEIESEVNTVKSIMLKNKKDSVETDKFIATLSKRESEVVDEDLLVTIIKEIGAIECLKTKEYVDSDILEQMIYADKIKADDIAKLGKATTTKVSYALTVKKKKEKK